WGHPLAADDNRQCWRLQPPTLAADGESAEGGLWSGLKIDLRLPQASALGGPNLLLVLVLFVPQPQRARLLVKVAPLEIEGAGRRGHLAAVVGHRFLQD